MFKLSKKGGFIAGVFMLIIASVAVISTILFFFFSFKIQTRSESYDEYLWSKVQEVPLSLFSVDFKDETFVTNMNLLYYNKGEEEVNNYIKTIRDTVNKQLFYLTGHEDSNLGYTITIKTKKDPIIIQTEFKGQEGCTCVSKEAPKAEEVPYFECENCGQKTGEPCGREYRSGERGPDVQLCYDPKVIHYSKNYPMPLVFSGEDKFLTTIDYNAIELKGETG
jgi:hypothetical protein